MKKERKDTLSKKLKKETWKLLIKRIWPILITVYLFIFYIFVLVGKVTGLGTLGWLLSQRSLSYVVIVLAIGLIPFLYFIFKKECENEAWNNVPKYFSRLLVERMMKPGIPVKVCLVKTRDSYWGTFIMSLQSQGKADFYAILGEKDNLISVYGVLKGDDEQIHVEFISKEEFGEYYMIL